ncbi:MAG: hypothetical protein A2Z14_16940 [Chloroflexi bacterium RBG_16_48_8]|nr:MAG: hypothetical protein A2Z14_16940 [Chloroflexi bacterium RBG_16_48_8]
MRSIHIIYQLLLISVILILLTSCKSPTIIPDDVNVETDASDVEVETNPQRDSFSIRILTQNTYLLPSYSEHLESRLPCIQEMLSDYHILALQEVFDDCSGSDCAANKGTLYACIQVGTTPQDYIHLYNTHIQSDEDEPDTRAKQLRELQGFIIAVTSDDRPSAGPVEHPVILLGDLNIDGQSTNDEYT